MFVSYKQFDKPKIFNYHLFQPIGFGLLWVFELALIYLWFAHVLRFKRGLMVFYGLGGEGNIRVNIEIVKKIFNCKIRKIKFEKQNYAFQKLTEIDKHMKKLTNI